MTEVIREHLPQVYSYHQRGRGLSIKTLGSVCPRRSVQDMEVMELMNVSCCWEMNDNMPLEYRRLVKAMLGHLVGWF